MLRNFYTYDCKTITFDLSSIIPFRVVIRRRENCQLSFDVGTMSFLFFFFQSVEMIFKNGFESVPTFRFRRPRSRKKQKKIHSKLAEHRYRRNPSVASNEIRPIGRQTVYREKRTYCPISFIEGPAHVPGTRKSHDRLRTLFITT